MKRLRARLEALRREELKLSRAQQTMKQGRLMAAGDGMNDDAVLVDEPELLKCNRELGSSDEDTSRGLCFQRRDRLAEVTLQLDRVLPRKVVPRARDDVLRLRLKLLCPHAQRAWRLFVAGHRRPGALVRAQADVPLQPELHLP